MELARRLRKTCPLPEGPVPYLKDLSLPRRARPYPKGLSLKPKDLSLKPKGLSLSLGLPGSSWDS